MLKEKGILSKLKLLFERNRLGELLVAKGALTPHELHQALQAQKQDGAKHLGRILLQQRYVSRRTLYTALTQQLTVRFMAAAATLIISFAALGGVKPARAGTIKDVPAKMTLVSVANPAFAPVKNHAPLFGTNEKESTNLQPFTKWSGMFERFDAAMHTQNGQKVIREWQTHLAAYQGLPLIQMAQKVNDLVNKQPYIVDSKNWGKSDYWETPIEFFTKGGDCEDFAIAKYASLRALGVPEDRMRVAIIHDEIKDMPHAVLILYTDNGPVLLDNQIKDVRYTDTVTRYRPIFTINRHAWWLHTQPATTVIASAR